MTDQQLCGYCHQQPPVTEAKQQGSTAGAGVVHVAPGGVIAGLPTCQECLQEGRHRFQLTREVQSGRIPAPPPGPGHYIDHN